MSQRGCLTAMAVGSLVLSLIVPSGCGSSPEGTTVGTSPLQTGTTVSTGAPAPSVVFASTTETTAFDEYASMTTSGVFAARGREATEAATQLGEAVVSYLSGKAELAAVQALVADSARDGLARMLSLLGEPTGCKVWSYGASDPYTVIEVDLIFADGTSQQPDYGLTVTFHGDKPTITAISPQPYVDIPPPVGPSDTGTKDTLTDSSPPVIELQAEPDIWYMNHDYAYYTAEAVVLATVIDVLPLRRNPLAGTGEPTGPNEPQPIVYKGYVLEVEKAYGPSSIPERITVYTVGNGTVELDGITYEVREDFPLDVDPGDRLFAPLMKIPYHGTPELEPDEYWVQENLAVYAVDDSGNCTRVTGATLDPEAGSEYPLSTLEEAAVKAGKQPSAVR